MEIITGKTGRNHVQSSDDASLYRAIFGDGDYVLNVGNKLEATVISNNLIRIADGDVMIQGRQGRTRVNNYDELTINNGSPGLKRHDLIVARYVKNGDTGVESINLFVNEGIPSIYPTDPPTIQDNIIEGGTAREFPLYRVVLDGINIEKVEKLFITPIISRTSEVIADHVIKQGTLYTKWASGKLECWGDIRVNHSITTPWGSSFYSDIGGAFFAHPFISTPFMTYNYILETGALISEVYLETSTTNTRTGTFSVMRPTATSGVAAKGWISFHATGRWK